MPYKLRRAPKKNLYWVVNKETGEKYSKEPLPEERAKAQMRALYAAESKEGAGLLGDIYGKIKSTVSRIISPSTRAQVSVAPTPELNVDVGLPTTDLLQQMAKISYDGGSVNGWTLLKRTPTLAFFNRGKTIVIAVRGTYDKRDLRADIAVPLDNLENTDRFKDDLRVVQEFQSKNPSYNYYATGHSLGGAIIDKFLQLGLVKDAISFNPAIEPSDYQKGDRHRRIYLENDPLYKLMGKNAVGTEVRKSNKYSLLRSIPGVGELIDSALSHSIDNFVGGNIEEKMIKMPKADYYAEHKRIIDLLNKTSASLKKEADEQEGEVRKQRKDAGGDLIYGGVRMRGYIVGGIRRRVSKPHAIYKRVFKMASAGNWTGHRTIAEIYKQSGDNEELAEEVMEIFSSKGFDLDELGQNFTIGDILQGQEFVGIEGDDDETIGSEDEEEPMSESDNEEYEGGRAIPAKEQRLREEQDRERAERLRREAAERRIEEERNRMIALGEERRRREAEERRARGVFPFNNPNINRRINFEGQGKMTLPMLKAKAKAMGLKGVSTMKKAQLMEALAGGGKAMSKLDTLLGQSKEERELMKELAKGRKTRKELLAELAEAKKKLDEPQPMSALERMVKGNGKMTLPMLKAKCKAAGIKGYSKMKKAQLEEALNGKLKGGSPMSGSFRRLNRKMNVPMAPLALKVVENVITNRGNPLGLVSDLVTTASGGSKEKPETLKELLDEYMTMKSKERPTAPLKIRPSMGLEGTVSPKVKSPKVASPKVEVKPTTQTLSLGLPPTIPKKGKGRRQLQRRAPKTLRLLAKDKSQR